MMIAKRLLAVGLALIVVAAPAVADIRVVSRNQDSGNAVTSAVTPGVTTATGCTNEIIYGDAADLINCEGALGYTATTNTLTLGTTLSASDSGSGNGAFTLLKSPTGGSATSNFLALTGTQPSTLTANFGGLRLAIAGAGSSSFTSSPLRVTHSAGYTGSSSTFGAVFTEANAGTATLASSFTALTGNSGVYSISNATTTGTNIGVAGTTANGDVNIGLWGYALGTKNSATMIGVLGIGNNGGSTPIRVGGYFGLDAATPTFVESALVADNASVAAPIFTQRDGGSIVGQTVDGGATWAKVGTKTLTESSATLFVRYDVASNGRQGGVVDYCVDANDASDYQTRCGYVSFSGVNKAGTETCTVGTPADSVAESTGASTLTVSFDTETAGTNQCGIRATAASSLTQTTLRINYHVRLFGNAATAVTAQ